jgi:hypothetical protein
MGPCCGAGLAKSLCSSAGIALNYRSRRTTDGLKYSWVANLRLNEVLTLDSPEAFRGIVRLPCERAGMQTAAMVTMF